ncbi:uncharacterized protein, partial [Parasteatoda tepidariorum]|uniref:uncharacterized protein n=1 Tax=Parasteatoda tepidariorum TaxID=114398 RepID=UPI0039BCFE59
MPNNFAIVKFLLTDEVAVVPVTWLSTKGCVWPLKAYEVMKLVVKLSKPSADWICHEAKLLGEYETYEDARKDLSKAEERSDLESDAEKGKGKRRKIAKKLNIGSSSDEDVPVPPFFSNSLTFSESTGIVAPIVPVDFFLECLPKEKQLPEGSVVIAANDETPDLTFHNIPADDDTSPVLSDDLSGSSSPTTNNQVLMKQMMLMDEKLKLILQNQETLYNMLQANAVVQNNSEEELNFILPISSMEDIDQVEKELADSKTQEILIKRLSTCGGGTVDATVKRTLVKLLSNSVAENFSWLGAKGKRNFSLLKLSAIVFSAVRRNPSVRDHATDHDIEKSV